MAIGIVLLRALLVFLMIGSVAGLIVGVGLILRPHWLAQVGLTTNRWISTRPIDRALEIPINIDAWFYRYHRAAGSVLAAGAMYILYFFSVRLDKAKISADFVGVLCNAMILTAQLGSAFALGVSLIVLFRPSLLRKFEQGGNEWISSRRAMKPLEIMRNHVDEFTFRHTQKMGVVLVLCSIYILAVLTFWVVK